MAIKDIKDFNTHCLLKYIENRIYKENKNLMVVIVGECGSGKSYAGLSIAEQLDPNFSVNNVAFSPEEFMDLVHSSDLPRGSVILMDEFGVSMDSRKWHSVGNKLLSYVLETFRYKGYVVFFTVPDVAFIDTNARRLVHAQFKTNGILVKENVCRIRPYFTQNDVLEGNCYRKFLNVSVDGHRKTIDEIRVPLPSVKLRHEYEAKKQIYANQLYDSIKIDLSKGAKVNKVEIKDKVIELLNQGMTQTKISRLLGIPRSNIWKIMKERNVI